MKKLTPYICTLVYSILGGLWVESVIHFLAIMSSPFADFSLKPFLIFCIITSILSALVIVITVIINSAYLINLDNKHKVKITIFWEFFVGIIPFLLFGKFWDYIVEKLYWLL